MYVDVIYMPTITKDGGMAARVLHFIWSNILLLSTLWKVKKYIVILIAATKKINAEVHLKRQQIN